jgi:YD repeat-containing protein
LYWTVYEYDGLGRTVKVKHPGGGAGGTSGSTVYVYEGNTVKVTDPAGKWKKHTLDGMGNLVQVSEPGGLESYYTYNAVNQLVQVRMPRGSVEQIRTFTYNGALRLASVTNPETGTTSYTYNGNGTVATRTDAKGQVTSYSYDTSGRLTQVNRGSCEQVTTSWDSQGYAPGFSVYTTGRVAATQTVLGCTGLTVTEVYSYTVGGLVAKKRLRVNRFGGNNVDLDGVYGYNNEGQVTTLQYPATSMGAGPALTQGVR